MKKLITICLLIATAFSVNAQQKPTKEETIAFMNRTLKSTIGFEGKDGKIVEIDLNQNTSIQMPANAFFNAALWLQTSFKNELFYAYNDRHLEYLERYISAVLREHKDRSHFTLLEKLPKFYHEAKNREGLLKIISKLKNK